MQRAMILGAGVGSRLEPLSHHIPKPLVPVLNIPVIEHILHGLKEHGIKEVVINTHYLFEIMHAYFADNPSKDIKLQLVHEPELSGDAGGVRACRSYLEGETFLVIMGDLLTNADISSLFAEHKSKKALATIGVKEMKDVTRFGVMRRDASGFIHEFQEKPSAAEAISHDISTGIYILEPEIFKHIPPTGVYGFGRQLFPQLVKAGFPVLGADIKGHWSDIGTLEDLYLSNFDALMGKIAVYKPAERLARAFPGAQISGKVLIGSGCTLGEGTELCCKNIIGRNCQIGRNVRLENVLVLPDSKIPSGIHLKNCIYAYNEIIPVDVRACRY